MSYTGTAPTGVHEEGANMIGASGLVQHTEAEAGERGTKRQHHSALCSHLQNIGR